MSFPRRRESCKKYKHKKLDLSRFMLDSRLCGNDIEAMQQYRLAMTKQHKNEKQ
ncbi:branched-chain amino acid aminotransferase [Rickettsia bellii OSU 85-389]|nr:branched-chain amino acid aminotransferase [Rickettsia bellii OSU 85-389]